MLWDANIIADVLQPYILGWNIDTVNSLLDRYTHSVILTLHRCLHSIVKAYLLIQITNHYPLVLECS